MTQNCLASPHIRKYCPRKKGIRGHLRQWESCRIERKPGEYMGRNPKRTLNRKTLVSWNLEGQGFGVNETKADIFNRNRKDFRHCRNETDVTL